jgi:hypothetical protein
MDALVKIRMNPPAKNGALVRSGAASVSALKNTHTKQRKTNLNMWIPAFNAGVTEPAILSCSAWQSSSCQTYQVSAIPNLWLALDSRFSVVRGPPSRPMRSSLAAPPKHDRACTPAMHMLPVHIREGGLSTVSLLCSLIA